MAVSFNTRIFAKTSLETPAQRQEFVLDLSQALDQLLRSLPILPPTGGNTVYYNGAGQWSTPAGSGGGGVVQVWGETPTGAINGINLSYTSANPYSPGSLAVYLNGLRLRRSADYTETGSNSFHLIVAPLSGDSLSIDYIQP